MQVLYTNFFWACIAVQANNLDTECWSIAHRYRAFRSKPSCFEEQDGLSTTIAHAKLSSSNININSNIR